jgi:hypothetical protein
VPHSGPFARGIHATVQARLKSPRDAARPSPCCASSTRAPFVRVLDNAPRVKDIVASNYAHLPACANGKTVAVMSVVDNLNKGAAGGAVQWMNRLFDLPEPRASLRPRPAGPDHERIESTDFARRRARAGLRAIPDRSGRRRRRVAAHAGRPQGSWTCTAATRWRRWATGHKGWTRALADQAAQMNFQTNAVPMEIRARAAHKLLKFSKLPFDSVFWINSGAEANENAFKLAFKNRPGRTHVAAVEQSFHGRTAACASATWQAPQKWFFLPRAPFDVELDQAPRRRRHRDARHREHGGRHRRARAGRGRRLRHGPGVPRGTAQPVQRDRRTADLRRGPVRRGPQRHAVRG